jgi:hypothetical protein
MNTEPRVVINSLYTEVNDALPFLGKLATLKIFNYII